MPVRPVTTPSWMSALPKKLCWRAETSGEAPGGAPRDPGFRFCEKPVVAIGKSYCAEHTRKAYVRPNRADAEQTAQSAD